MLGVALILAVPVAQRIKWRHGLASSNFDIVGNSVFVFVPVSHEIPVAGIWVHGTCHPVDAVHLLVEGKRHRTVATFRLWRLIDDRPSGTRDDAILQIRALVVTAGGIEGTFGALQVQRVILAWIPYHFPAVEPHGDAQVVGRPQAS